MPAQLNLVFCGTPKFAVPVLRALAEAAFHISLVVTQPDRPRGRGMEVALSPVKQLALELSLPIAQPEKIKANEAFRHQLNEIHPDAIIVVGYGRIIPQWMIDLPPMGNLNLHASLLPKYRGAAPIQWAIANGETVTGVTTMRIDAGLDTGDALMQESLPIDPEETAETLSSRLSAIGAPLMIETLRGLADGRLQPHPQDDTYATLAPVLKKDDGEIDFRRSATEILNRLRGFQPWPGAYTQFRGKNLTVWAAMASQKSNPEGEIVIESGRLLVGCGARTSLDLLEVQMEGKKRMLAPDFLNGYKPRNGEKLGVNR